MRTNLRTEIQIIGHQLEQQMSELISVREEVAQAELAARQIPRRAAARSLLINPVVRRGPNSRPHRAKSS